MHVLVTGAAGMLGRALLAALASRGGAARVTPVDIDDFDLADAAAVVAALDRHRPDVVFNCAAFTAVDECETRREYAEQVNGEAPGVLARWCRAHGARLVHISSDYVFDGAARAPIAEDAATGPVSAYGASKLLGEQRVAQAGGDYLIVRTAWLFAPWGRSFLQFVLGRLTQGQPAPVITDQVGSPTYAPDLAEALVRLIEVRATGIVHFVNTGACTWAEFAEHLRTCAGLSGTLTPIVAADLHRPAARPAYSVLATQRYTRLVGNPPRTWQDAARDAVQRWRCGG
ncbi:MAG TPA: dTDP-4-dehydrorhamnose reductase [Phycisphaerae bacterium]|nr:dTDP-4-dehydrorhamnose reductase [Phycisphaerae bacterium]HNU46652.1 dTDP-4-dehydrorhamnose reductase [Phycisphaerae bacterium]